MSIIGMMGISSSAVCTCVCMFVQVEMHECVGRVVSPWSAVCVCIYVCVCVGGGVIDTGCLCNLNCSLLFE